MVKWAGFVFPLSDVVEWAYAWGFTSAGRRRCVAGNGSFRAAKCKTTANLIAIMSSSTVRQRSVGDELREKRKGNTRNIACNKYTDPITCLCS